MLRFPGCKKKGEGEKKAETQAGICVEDVTQSHDKLKDPQT